MRHTHEIEEGSKREHERLSLIYYSNTPHTPQWTGLNTETGTQCSFSSGEALTQFPAISTASKELHLAACWGWEL